jgi:hypothetical protein
VVPEPVVSEIPVVAGLSVSELPDVSELSDVSVQSPSPVELEPIVACGSSPEPVPTDELVGRVFAVSAWPVAGVVTAVSDEVPLSLSHPSCKAHGTHKRARTRVRSMMADDSAVVFRKLAE